ncbi:hypothetical protein BGZ97_008078 [Linnemannia gamsii]|jgi:uncharacterized lipoprotein YbaY|uniref:Uncharacterized protein n=1 Tax=Linnemannia gamsii TaxID=64522 RepID=A0A9P6QSB6_9FUNG|nr:hypothetical protein BGZ97_008078 [Linnemannia gamsii]
MTFESVGGRLYIKQSGGETNPDSRITVKLLDMSRPEAGAVTISRQIILTGPRGRPFPIEFKVLFDSRDYSPEKKYALSARVEDMTGDERLQYISAYHHHLPMNGRTQYGISVLVHTIC